MQSNEEPICGNGHFTSINDELTNLVCDLPPEHEGPHIDHRHEPPVSWEALGAESESEPGPLDETMPL